MCCYLNKITSQHNAKEAPTHRPHASQDFFIKFHGRMVNILTPLSPQNPLKDLAKRIGHVMAAIFVYPAWGIVKLAEKYRPQKEIVQAIETPKVSHANIVNPTFKDMIIAHISEHFDTWSFWEGVQGEEVKVFAGLQIKDPQNNVKNYVVNTLLKKDSQTIESYIQGLAHSIKNKVSGSFGHGWELCIRIYVVNEIEKKSYGDFVHFQNLAFTYQVDGNTLKSIQHGGDLECHHPKDFMAFMFKRDPRKLQNPEYPWDEMGKFKPVTIEIT